MVDQRDVSVLGRVRRQEEILEEKAVFPWDHGEKVSALCAGIRDAAYFKGCLGAS